MGLAVQVRTVVAQVHYRVQARITIITTGTVMEAVVGQRLTATLRSPPHAVQAQTHVAQVVRQQPKAKIVDITIGTVIIRPMV